jgi:5'-nucleotidase
VLESAQQYGIAHLLTLLQPDSRQLKRIDTRFPGIHHFDEIMPGEPLR